MTTENGRSTAVLVLGAGRSGTSAITRGVQALGVDLGDKLRPPGGKNPTGFFEDQDLLALNKRLKRELGIRGYSLRLIEAQEWQKPGVRALQDQAKEIIGRRFAQSPVWGFKYARTLRMLPFWEQVLSDLEINVRYVLALRNPLSVARSRSQLNPERGHQAWSDLEWLVNVVPYFRQVLDHRLCAVDFDALLADPAVQLHRVADQLQLPLGVPQEEAINEYAQEFLRPAMRHSRYTLADLDEQGAINPLVRDAYRYLHQLAYDEMQPDNPELGAEWQRIAKALDDLAPVLLELDRLRARLNSALWNPATPIQALRQLWRDYRSR